MEQKVGRIRRRSSFRALARPDGRASSDGLSVAFVRTNPEAELVGLPVVGYAVGRQVGTAVARNRLRRRLRAAARDAAPVLETGAYLVRAEPGAASLPFAALSGALREAATGASRAADRRRKAAAR